MQCILRGMVKLSISEEISDSIKLNLFGKKAGLLCVSKFLLTGRRASDGINISKLIHDSSSRDDFKDKVVCEVSRDDNTDFLHFSLIMGLYFGCFNLYNYLYVSPQVRKKIVWGNIDRNDTVNFIIKNYSSLLEYFQAVYGIDDEFLRATLSKVMLLNDEDMSLYNSDVVRDLGKILMGRTLKGEYSNCYDAIAVFDEENKSVKAK